MNQPPILPQWLCPQGVTASPGPTRVLAAVMDREADSASGRRLATLFALLLRRHRIVDVDVSSHVFVDGPVIVLSLSDEISASVYAQLAREIPAAYTTGLDSTLVDAVSPADSVMRVYRAP